MDLQAILDILSTAQTEASTESNLVQWSANYINGTISFGATMRQVDGNGDPVTVNGQTLYSSMSVSRQLAPPQS